MSVYVIIMLWHSDCLSHNYVIIMSVYVIIMLWHSDCLSHNYVIIMSVYVIIMTGLSLLSYVIMTVITMTQ